MRLLATTTSGLRTLDRQSLGQFADWLAVAVAVSLPWSTTATIVLIVLWLLAVLPTMDSPALREQVMSAAGGLPVLLWGLAALGMLWADVAWADRFAGLGGFHRLLAIPLLLAQFRRSPRGPWVCYGFFASAAVVMAVSWILVLLPPRTLAQIPSLGSHVLAFGVPVKDYVWQSGIFLMSALVLVEASYRRMRTGSWWPAIALLGLAAGFLAYMVFVITSRTTILVAPVLAVALGYRLFGWRGVAIACVLAAALAGIAFKVSPGLHLRVSYSLVELRDYLATGASNSTGLHLEYLRKSIAIVETAPVVGHGTGSIAEQFGRMASGAVGTASAASTVNPHSQIFAVAIELGVVGAVVLLAMWAAHVRLFRGAGPIAWIGMVIVVENIVSSLVNSHLFDFAQGWLYVFIVGAAGGAVLRQRDAAAAGAQRPE
jgi:O-antigen ligase